MIRFENVNKRFGKLEVLKNVCLQFELGQSVAIIGPNGSGKTTLIKSLLGMVIPQTGIIYFDNQPIRGAYNYRAAIGYMPQIGQYPPNLRISQLIEMMIDIRNDSPTPPTRIDEDIIEAFRLKEIYTKPLGTLSGGTKQKVSAALAFLFDPKVLILDEPTAGLDPLSSELLKHKIRTEIKKGKLLLITSHILSDLEELASHIVYMQEGEVQVFKELRRLQEDNGEQKLSKIIANLMQT